MSETLAALNEVVRTNLGSLRLRVRIRNTWVNVDALIQDITVERPYEGLYEVYINAGIPEKTDKKQG